jgi:hypothetical protein
MNGDAVPGGNTGRPGGAPARFDEADLRTALSMAIRAPSIHNSQPWCWRIRPHGVELLTDATWRLPRTDPVGRDQVMSCGAGGRSRPRRAGRVAQRRPGTARRRAGRTPRDQAGPGPANRRRDLCHGGLTRRCGRGPEQGEPRPDVQNLRQPAPRDGLRPRRTSRRSSRGLARVPEGGLAR